MIFATEGCILRCTTLVVTILRSSDVYVWTPDPQPGQRKGITTLSNFDETRTRIKLNQVLKKIIFVHYLKQ